MPPSLGSVAIPSRRRLSCPPARAKSGDRRACRAGARPRAGAGPCQRAGGAEPCQILRLGLGRISSPPVCSEKRATAKWCSAACSRWRAISTSFAANFRYSSSMNATASAMMTTAAHQQIIGHLRQVNPQIRLLGLTATPFRLGKGWIYQFHYHGMVRGDEKALFRDCI